ncbi:MAG TPA: hypothetical protein VHS06_10225 [Chloroflexota bacterium]|nr:hypothetical protein [Chloroflexota bacterium]
MKGKVIRWLPAVLAALFAIGMLPITPSSAQETSRTFPETGKSVSGKFLQYWDTHGGLAQQGIPISNEMQEKSDTDGKVYTVQYFERAVFELHPENQPPNDVLLQLLGVFRYKEMYPGGAPGQVASSEPGAVLFNETGHRVGGLFLAYWQSHGGLAQQGFPISEEFNEVSALNGQTYRVQYFERAVFEYHPENQPPHNVLLSQLGKFRWDEKNDPTPTPTLPPPPPRPVSPTPTPVPHDPNTDCSGIPASVNQEVRPNCGPAGTKFTFRGWGFKPGEKVGVYVTEPSQAVYGPPWQATASSSGEVRVSLTTGTRDPAGIWATTMEGIETHAKAIGYFKVTGSGTPPPPTGCSDVPAPVSMKVAPSTCAQGGTRFEFLGSGFTPGEKVGVYVTEPSQAVYGPPWQIGVDGEGYTDVVSFQTEPDFPTGIWAMTMEGVTSHHKAIGYFKILPPK